MKRVINRTFWVLCALWGTVACGSESGSTADGETLVALDRDLQQGMTGDDVRAVYAYLEASGYFPNETFAQAYPDWRPAVTTTPEDLDYFGPELESAVLALQHNSGLEPTGVVDEATRDLLQTPRCGVPDGITEPDDSEKWALFDDIRKWPKTSLTWKLANTDGNPTVNDYVNRPEPTLSAARAAVGRAFASWTSVTSLSFQQITSGTPDIALSFATLGSGSTAPTGASGSPNSSGTQVSIVINDYYSWWANPSAPEANYKDLQSTALHEIGHALGLRHSQYRSATMWAHYQYDRSLSYDDELGISALYDTWTRVSGAARDIGINGYPAEYTWVIGNTQVYSDGTLVGYTVHKYEGGGWTRNNFGRGVRIAVDHSGIPWTVDAQGKIWRANSTAANTSWTQIPGCANDIGSAPTSQGTTWVVGCTPVTGGMSIHYYNGSGWTKVNGYGAMRISADAQGNAWWISDDLKIYRRSRYTGTVENIPGRARDIAGGVLGDIWVIGNSTGSGGWGIYTWNQQSYVDNGNGVVDDQDAPSAARWIRVSGSGTSIATGTSGPWHVNNIQRIYRRTK